MTGAAQVDPAAVEAFQRDGAVCLRQVFSAAEIDALRDEIDALMRAPSPRAKLASAPGDPGVFFEDFRNWDSRAGLRRLVEDSAAGAIAGRLMRSRAARFYHDHVLVKTAGATTPTPWHQDQPYYNIEGRQNVSFWIPVDPVGRETTLEFVAGSHLGPWYMPRTFRDQQARWFPPGALQEPPDIDTDTTRFPVLGWALQPGDMVCFHMLTLHRAGGGAPTGPRRVFSARFLGDDIRHSPRPWTTSPDFPELAGVLPAGAVMDHPLFPIVWRGDPAAGR